jgi:hypothetical protein
MHIQHTFFFFLDKFMYNRHVHKYVIYTHSLCLTLHFLEDKDEIFLKFPLFYIKGSTNV